MARLLQSSSTRRFSATTTKCSGPRLGALQCGITWIYGDRDWMRHEHASFALENTVPPEFRVASAVRVLKGAAHNVQVDAWQEVNVILGELARKHTV